MTTPEYSTLQKNMAIGWNTWDTRSYTAHVLLPHGYEIACGLKEYVDGAVLSDALMGRPGEGVETLTPGIRSYDGSYTDLTLTWRGYKVRIRTCSKGSHLVIAAEWLNPEGKPPSLIVEGRLVWNRQGTVSGHQGGLTFAGPHGDVRAWTTGRIVDDPYCWASGPYCCLSLSEPIVVTVGEAPLPYAEANAIISRAGALEGEKTAQQGVLSSTYRTIQGCLAWNTVYDPLKDRVISPVSRVWSRLNRGGYVIFVWDNFFAGLMASIDNKELAYANVVEVTREISPDGLIPNNSQPHGSSFDRSQPPVGSMCVRALYLTFGDGWLVEEVYDALLRWNDWWWDNRRYTPDNALLSWGSAPSAFTADYTEPAFVDTWLAAAWESGLDNSPMWDGIPFDADRHMLAVQDVGLNSLYAADCLALAELADLLEKTDDANRLRTRYGSLREGMAELWSNDVGLFLNRRLTDGTLSGRKSPTHFYPLLAGLATPEQALRMVDGHLMNPDEFWGEWVLPSISRDDVAFGDQIYWRGRVWPPLNLLVYWGLVQSGFDHEASLLADKSHNLLMKEWSEQGHVHENYNAITGSGCDGTPSDPYYHWGGLLGLLSYYEAGRVRYVKVR